MRQAHKTLYKTFTNSTNTMQHNHPMQIQNSIQSSKNTYIYDPLGPASSSSGLSNFCLFPLVNKSPKVLLRLLALVTRDQFVPLSVPNDLLWLCSASPSFAGEGGASSSSPSVACEYLFDPDFVLLRLSRRLMPFRIEESRRMESATTAARPPERGDSRGPGIIRAIECRTGVKGRSPCGGAGPV